MIVRRPPGRRTATVVGGGLAGLSAAASLLHAGWQVLVLVRAAGFGEVGAGLAVTSNGMAALDALGVGDQVRAAGFETFAAAPATGTAAGCSRSPRAWC